MPTAQQPNPLPPIEELESSYKVERMVLAKRRRALFRHRTHRMNSVIVVERDDRWWQIDRLESGRVTASKILKTLPHSDYYELVTGKQLPPWLKSS